MKHTTFVFLLAALLGISGCENRIEHYADRLEESMERFGDAMEDFGDAMERMADSLTNDTTILHGTTTIRLNGRAIRINGQDRYLTHRFNGNDFNALRVSHCFRVVMCDTVDSVVVRINEKLDNHLQVRLQRGCLAIGLKDVGNLSMEGNVPCGYVYIPYRPKLKGIELSGSTTFQTTLPIRSSGDFDLSLSGATRCSIQGGIFCQQLEVDLSGEAHCQADFQFSSASLELNGASRLDGVLRGRKADFDINGTSEVSSNVSLTDIEVELNGASQMWLKGKTDQLSLDLSGSTQLDAAQLIVATAKGEMSGACNAHLHATRTIAVEVSGSSHLICSGPADISRSSASYAASISKL